MFEFKDLKVSKSGIDTAGFWSKNILWNKPTIEASLKDVKAKYFK
jgi:hypothetical protein